MTKSRQENFIALNPKAQRLLTKGDAYQFHSIAVVTVFVVDVVILSTFVCVITFATFYRQPGRSPYFNLQKVVHLHTSAVRAQQCVLTKYTMHYSHGSSILIQYTIPSDVRVCVLFLHFTVFIIILERIYNNEVMSFQSASWLWFFADFPFILLLQSLK